MEWILHKVFETKYWATVCKGKCSNWLRSGEMRAGINMLLLPVFTAEKTWERLPTIQEERISFNLSGVDIGCSLCFHEATLLTDDCELWLSAGAFDHVCHICSDHFPEGRDPTPSFQRQPRFKHPSIYAILLSPLPPFLRLSFPVSARPLTFCLSSGPE